MIANSHLLQRTKIRTKSSLWEWLIIKNVRRTAHTRWLSISTIACYIVIACRSSYVVNMCISVHGINMRCSGFGLPGALVFLFAARDVIHHLMKALLPRDAAIMQCDNVVPGLYHSYECLKGLKLDPWRLEIRWLSLLRRLRLPSGLPPSKDTWTRYVRPCLEDASSGDIWHPGLVWSCGVSAWSIRVQWAPGLCDR